MADQDFSGFLDNQPNQPDQPAKKAGQASTKGVARAPIADAQLDEILAQEGATHLKPIILAIYGQESRGGNQAKSIDGAVGGMQVIPATFARFAKPGESNENPRDNMATAVRYVKFLAKVGDNDPAKIAAGYFSGEGNIAKDGPTPYKADRRDGNNFPVSRYVKDILGRMDGQAIGEAAPEAPAGKAPTWKSIAENPRYAQFTPAERKLAQQQYFNKWIAPKIPADQRGAYQSYFMDKAAGLDPKEQGLFDKLSKHLEPGVVESAKQGFGVIGAHIRNALGVGEYAQEQPTQPVQPAIENGAIPTGVQIDDLTGLPVDSPNRSVMEKPGVPQGTPVTSPLRPEVRAAAQHTFDAATPEQRAKMAAQPSALGDVAAERARQYQRMDETIPENNALDPRAEARSQRLARDGMDPSLSGDWGREGARRGDMPGTEVQQARSTMSAAREAELAEVKRMYNEDPFYSSTPVRAAVKAWDGTVQGYTGVNRFVAEVIGADEAAKNYGKWSADRADETKAMGEPKERYKRLIEGAATSIMQQLPALVGGAVTGSTALTLGSMFFQSFGQEYNEGRNAGQTPEQATTRAAQFAALEVIGEKFGLGNSMAGIKAAAKGDIKAATSQLAKALAKEVPGEQLTTLGQFLVDKEGHGVGMNPNAGLDQYLEQAIDTLGQTLIQGGMMMGAGRGVAGYVDSIGRREIAQTIRDTPANWMYPAEEIARAQLDPNGGELVDPATTRKPGAAPTAEEVAAVQAEREPAAAPTETEPAEQPPVAPAPASGKADKEALQHASTRLATLQQQADDAEASDIDSQIGLNAIGIDALAGGAKGAAPLTDGEKEELAFLKENGQNAAKVREYYGMQAPQEEAPAAPKADAPPKGWAKHPYEMTQDEHRAAPDRGKHSGYPFAMVNLDEQTEESLLKLDKNVLFGVRDLVGAVGAQNRKKVAKDIMRIWELRGELAEATVDSLMEKKGDELHALSARAKIFHSALDKKGMAENLINWRNKQRKQAADLLQDAKHYARVKKAIADGKEVSPKVLADYPELAYEKYEPGTPQYQAGIDAKVRKLFEPPFNGVPFLIKSFQEDAMEAETPKEKQIALDIADGLQKQYDDFERSAGKNKDKAPADEADDDKPTYAGQYDIVTETADTDFQGYTPLGMNPDGKPLFGTAGGTIRRVVDGKYTVTEKAHKPESERFAEFKTQAELRELRGDPYKNSLYGTVDKPLKFASGMSRPGDFTMAFDGGANVGIDINELSKVSTPKIAAALAASKGRLFVDTGAFSLFKVAMKAQAKGTPIDVETGMPEGVKPLDFDKIMERFNDLGRAIGEADDSGFANDKVFFVMPDVIGNQKESLELVSKYKKLIRGYSINGIVPLQIGELSFTAAYEDMMRRLDLDPDTDVSPIIGIPSNAAAVPHEEFLALMQKHGDRIYGVHILGVASKKTLDPRLATLREAGYDGNVSADANTLRTYLYSSDSRAEAMRKMLAGDEKSGAEKDIDDALDDLAELMGTPKDEKPKTEKQAKEKREKKEKPAPTVPEVRTPATLDNFIGDVDAGYAARIGDTVMWIAPGDAGWTIKTQQKGSEEVRTRVGGLKAWTKADALAQAEQEAAPHFEAKPPKTEKEAQEGKDRQWVGRRTDGKMLYADKRGVRFYFDSGVQIWETVGIIPGGGISINRKADFMTVEELAADKPQEEAKPPKTEKEAAEAKALDAAKADIADALDELATLFGAKKNIMPEQEAKLLPILTKLFDGLFRAGNVKFKQAARAALDVIRKHPRLGDEVADQFTIDHLAGAYIAMAGKYQDQGADSRKVVAAFDTLEEVLAEDAPAEEQAPGAAPLPPIEFPRYLQGAGGEKAQLIRAIANHYAAGHGFKNITAARKLAADTVGGVFEDGTPRMKLLDEAIEVAGVLYARHVARHVKDKNTVYDMLQDFYENRQPRLGVRTSTSIAQQAYSTPLPLAWIASQLAGITQNTTVYEPTAGNGALLIAANPLNAAVNELNPDRLKSLEMQGFTPTGQDATKLTQPDKFDVVIENPPFGKIDGQQWTVPSQAAGGNYTTKEIDHAIVLKSLQAMKDDGSAVLIIGSVADFKGDRADQYLKSKAMKEFFLTLYGEYNVTDHFTVDGALYERQGAGWPVDVIVIKGKGKSALPKPWMAAPAVYSSWDKLKGKLNGQGDIRSTGQSDGNAPGDGERGGGSDSVAGGARGPSGGAGAGNDRPGTTGSAGSGNDGSGGTSTGGMGSGADGSGNGGNGTGGTAGNQAGGGRGDNQQPDDGAAEGRPGSAGGVSSNDRGGVDKPRIDAPVVKQQKKTEAETATQVSYVPASKINNVGTLVPVNLKDAVADSLRRLEERVGPVDDFVARELGYKNEVINEREKILKPLIKHDVQVADKVMLDAYAKGKPVVGADRFLGQVVKLATGKTALVIGAPRLVPSMGFEVQGMPVLINEGGRLSIDMAQPAFTTVVSGNGPFSPRYQEIIDAIGEYSFEAGDYLLNKYFSAEQIDSLALAIDNLQRGGGFIIGDQTGIGKGRVNAGIIRYALRQGMTPVFVTHKPNLYGDMFRDLNDIGQEEIKILMTNSGETVPLTDEADGPALKTPPAGKHNRDLQKMINNGMLDQDYNMVFTTYDSLNTIGGAKTVRMELVEMLSKGAILILDEAHNAGGAPVKQGAADKLNRSSFFRGLVAASQGVFYSSATYAKRPDVMDLYAKTEMRFAVANPKDLGPAIAAGGIPLQQVVAAMLARSGQYIRRERTFAGVQYDTVTVPVNRALAESSATVMRLIMDFDKAKKLAVQSIKNDVRAEAAAVSVDGSTGGAGAESMNFTSIMHNLIGQLLLALKVDQAADLAIADIKAGLKPVVTVANTMESLINEFADEYNVRVGEPITITFGDLMHRYLEKSRYITIKKPFSKDKGEKRRLTDAELGPQAVAIFNSTKEYIDKQDWSQLPASPIDALKAKLEKAGYKAAEITGRSGYIDYTGDQPIYRVRKQAEKSTAGRRKAIGDFNNGVVDVMILNQAGATGLSLHASPAVGTDTRQRSMILAQAELNIDTHMQMLGRVHRTGQIITPIYRQLVGNIPAENRPAAVLAKKMGGLSANTTGNKSSALSSADTPDFLNEIGDEAIAALMWNDQDLHDRLGEPLQTNDTGDGFATLDAGRKVTGRIPVLPLAEQEALYQRIEEDYRETLKNKEALGEAGLEAQSMDLQAKIDKETIVDAGSEQNKSEFAGPVKGWNVDVKRLGKPYTSKQVLDFLAEKYGDVAGLEEIQSVAQARLDVDIAAVRNDFMGYVAQLVVELDDRRAQQVGAVAHLTMARLEWAAANLAPGTKVEMVSPNGEIRYGVIAGFEKRGQAKNPAAGSIWKTTIFLADAAKQVTLPLSKIHTPGESANDANGRYRITPVEESSDGSDILQLFDTNQRVVREKRVIVAGNLLAGFSTYKAGQIVNFTMESGEVLPGILMPRGFDLAKETRKIVKTIATPEMALEFIDRNLTGRLVTEDGMAAIIRLPRSGNFRFTVPKSKKLGARFHQNKAITDLMIGREMVSRGGGGVKEMQGDLYANDLPELIRQLYKIGEPLKGMTAEQVQEANTLPNIRRTPARDPIATRATEHMDPRKQVRAKSKLKALQERHEGGLITDAEFMAAVHALVNDIRDKEWEDTARTPTGRVRGHLYVREKILNSMRNNRMDPELGQFMLWLLDQNPALAEDLGISVRTPKGPTPAGQYNHAARIITIFTDTDSTDTGVHEVMHHAERMMPAEVQEGVRRAWSRAWGDAFRNATDPKIRAALKEMIEHNFGNELAYRNVVQAFNDGVLNYDEHYQLVNPSEYWAVNASRILSKRHEADTWFGNGGLRLVARAALWLKEFIQRAKGAFGLRSDAPILAGLRAVMNGDGSFQSPEMLINSTGMHYQLRIPSANQVRQRGADLAYTMFGPTKKSFNWLHRSVSTQLHKALINPYFKPTFDAANRLLNQVSMSAVRPAELAPDILPKTDEVWEATKTLVRGSKNEKHMKVVGQALIAGTLQGTSVMDGKVYTPDELRTQFNMGTQARAMYYQARDAINQSLQEVATAEAWAFAAPYIAPELRETVIDNVADAEAILLDALNRTMAANQDEIDNRQRILNNREAERDRKHAAWSALAAQWEAMRQPGSGATRDEKQQMKYDLDMAKGEMDEKIAAVAAAEIKLNDAVRKNDAPMEAADKIRETYEHAQKLMNAGYFPLKRFGRFTVQALMLDDQGNVVKDEDGKPIRTYFGRFENEWEARKKERELQRQFSGDDVLVSRGTMDPDEYKLFTGINPETLALFAGALGREAVMEKYYREVLSERSALKARLDRDGIAGYSEDLPRVLAGFITSNARYAAQRYYLRDINNAIRKIPFQDGMTRGEAIRLRNAVIDPDEGGARWRGVMFVYFLGGSIASAAVNLMQPIMQTLPFLAKHGTRRASAALMKAVPYASGAKKIPVGSDLYHALQKASQEGIVDAQEVFHLYSVAIAGTTSKIVGNGMRSRAQAGMTMVGAFFSMAEKLNRRVTFIAAHNVAVARGERNPYAYAVQAVMETQGIYTKANRPNIARSGLGSVVMTFRQYGIAYVEMLTRLWKQGGPAGKKAVGIALALMILASGINGLPFMDLFDDLIDTVGQFAGYNTNMKRHKREWAEKLIGETFAPVALHGVSHFLPFDLSGRLGLANIAPASALLKKSTDNRIKEAFEILGAPGGLAVQMTDAFATAAGGSYGGALKEASPKFVRDLITGGQQAARGLATDKNGKKVAEVGLAGAVFQGAGFNPNAKAIPARMRNEIYQDVTMVNKVKQDIGAKFTEGVATGDSKMMEEAVADMQRWNEKNPRFPITLDRQSMKSRAKAGLLDADQRMITGGNRLMRGDIAERLDKVKK